jgi:hypothetical protein
MRHGPNIIVFHPEIPLEVSENSKTRRNADEGLGVHQ